jgi:hypothetical protein
VIVICPSCGTPYSHASEEHLSARSARCSRCTFTFPIPSGRSYRVEAGRSLAAEPFPAPCHPGDTPRVATTATELAIGMDDPALTTSLGKTALQQEAGKPRQAMTYWVVADGTRGTSPSGEAPAPEAEHGSEGKDPLSELSFEPAKPSRPRTALALAAGALGGMALGGAVVAAVGESLPIGAAVGCVSGIALAGGWIQWSRRRS